MPLNGAGRKPGVDVVVGGVRVRVGSSSPPFSFFEMHTHTTRTREVEAREALAALGVALPRHGEDHAMGLPLQAVLDAQLLEEPVQVRVRAEEDVEARLDPVPVLVFLWVLCMGWSILWNGSCMYTYVA